MGKTSIEWTDYSWPIVNGCRRVSEGCTNCYAERLTATRLSQTPKYKGLAVMKAGPERVLRKDHASGAVSLSKVRGPSRPRWTGETRLWVPHLDMPRRLKKPSRIFVADMGDLFYEAVPDEVIAAVFAVMAGCPQHTFQVLTKRPARARAWFKACGEPPRGTGFVTHNAHDPGAYGGDGVIVGNTLNWPLRNVWLGVSVEDQATADERIPILLDTPAALRFVSAEPLLGPVSLHPGWLGCTGHLAETFGNPLVNWVIVGGESGPGARPFDLAWARSLVGACRSAGAACFVKQLGAAASDPVNGLAGAGLHVPRDAAALVATRLRDRKGGDPDEWPEDLRVREFPVPRATVGPTKEEVSARGGDKSDVITAG